MDLNELKTKALEIATKKGWNKGSNKHYICLVISELMEAVEADRKNRHANLDMFYSYIDRDRLKDNIERFGEDFYDGLWKVAFQTYIKDTVEDELADAFIRLLHLAGLEHISLGKCGITPLYKENIYNTFTEWVYDVIFDLFDSDVEVVLNGLGNIFGYCLYNHIDLERHVIEKMKYNELRDNDKNY